MSDEAGVASSGERVLKTWGWDEGKGEAGLGAGLGLVGESEDDGKA